MPTVRLNGIDVYYERDGTGPRLLFLNGSGATIESSDRSPTPFRTKMPDVACDRALSDV